MIDPWILNSRALGVSCHIDKLWPTSVGHHVRIVRIRHQSRMVSSMPRPWSEQIRLLLCHPQGKFSFRGNVGELCVTRRRGLSSLSRAAPSTMPSRPRPLLKGRVGGGGAIWPAASYACLSLRKRSVLRRHTRRSLSYGAWALRHRTVLSMASWLRQCAFLCGPAALLHPWMNASRALRDKPHIAIQKIRRLVNLAARRGVNYYNFINYLS